MRRSLQKISVWLSRQALNVCLVVFAHLSLFAQENTATVTGQVLDSSGAGIAGANVTARNVQTGITRSTVTNETANYSIPLLPIGTYEVMAEREGFKKSVQKDIVLQVDQRARLDFTLDVGQTSETVEVTASVPLTQTDTSS